MSVALLLVTHSNIGTDMLRITSSIMNEKLYNVACIEVPMDADTENMKNKVANAMSTLSTENGILILTDSYGSTPCNIASDFTDGENTVLVSGLNLPMLIRTMNYRSLSLAELKDAAIEGGRQGIISTAG